MAQDAKLDMSLDQLIAQSRTGKPKPKAGAKPGAKQGAKQAPAKGKAAAGPGAKKGQAGNVRVVPRQPQQGSRAPLNLKTRGGAVQKPAGRGGKFVQAQQRGPAPRQPPPRPAPRQPPPRTYQPRIHEMQALAMGMGMNPAMAGMAVNPLAMAHMAQMATRGNMGGGGGMVPQQRQGGGAPQGGGKWTHDLYDEAQQEPPQPTSSKLFISNLDYKVTDDDVKELFSTCGELKDYGIHYDKSGRSLGTAHVVFLNPKHAQAAFTKYNNVALDGKKMSIEVVESAVPPGTFKTLSSGINVSRNKGDAAGRAGGRPGAAVRGRGHPVAGGGDFMQE